MSTFILYSGIVSFILINLTVWFKYLRVKPKWHKYLGFTTYGLVCGHAIVAIYKAIRLYYLYM